MKPIEQPWILAGYRLFAHEGPKGLTVEGLARVVGKSKSSFYHHFADLEVFTELLLRYHLNQVHRIAEQERQCQNVIPDLVNLLLTVKENLLFDRQLRIHRTIPAFKQCFDKSTGAVGEAISGIFADMLGLAHNSALTRMVLMLSLENFYLQLTPETLTYDWLVGYMHELQAMVRAFQANDRQQSILYGSV
ncbi:TetR/AcrR family transcriptional regulator [Fibrella aquatilis]|uniref:TetR/AcrR family transcriptional regulator n=1 Tax=Fibrella aquatilis TaxID=2817059 RepID=A0A939G3V1_9BACT|nr:TetR/AcrR family transcriptional regulator [Fibrella aquatilis]MBO0929940.1 TetR/AcrR family transcriptional regulator [Fibrella aquatilis]